MHRILLFVFILVIGCKSDNEKSKDTVEIDANGPVTLEAVTLLGDTLFTPTVNQGKAFENLKVARQQFQNNPQNVDSIIWYGRRMAYTGQFQKAIQIYSDGLTIYPKEARLYRHRGHRYISTRQFDLAISDFEKAAELVQNQPDKIEQDGLPNERNIPMGTLKSNIWYHLGLAHYLKGNMKKALEAYQKREVSNRYDDNLVSGGHWLFMILKRLGEDEKAHQAIEKVVPDMDIIENTSYYKMCLFYKGLLLESDLNTEVAGTSSNDIYLYGLGNWYLYQQKDTLKAKSMFKTLLEKGNPYSFAYLAAESDWKQLFD